VRKESKFFKYLAKPFLDILGRSEHIYMVVIAIIIGVLGGFGAVGFRYLIQLFQKIFWQTNRFSLFAVNNTPLLLRVAIPAFGGLLCGLLVYYFAKEARGHGVPEVMEAVALRSGVIRPRVVVVKALASAISIASGGSVGREGPIVQVGSALGSSIGQFFKANARQLKTLVGCGAAAGIAATFNAPIAGALFATEIILGDFGVSQFSPIVISSVAATVLSRHFMGNLPAFEIPKYQLVSAYEFIPYFILGISAGLIGVLYNICIHKSDDLFEKIALPDPVKAMLGGSIIGVIAFGFPQVYGVGYETITNVLRGNSVALTLLALIFVKILATSITLGSGGSGGIFAPSLFIGAMLGGLIGKIAHQFYPEITAPSGAYALVGMGAVVAAATHAPISAIIIIFELTNTYNIIPPLMVSCIISVLLAGRLKRESVYTDKLVRRGVDLYQGQDINILKNMHVKSIINKDILIIPENTSYPEIIKIMTNSAHQEAFIVDKNQKLIGYIPALSLTELISESRHLGQLIIASDIAQKIQPVLPDDNLDYVMHQFGRHRVDELPVIDNMINKTVIGAICQKDIIDMYNREIFKHDLAGGMHSLLSSISTDRSVEISDGYHLFEIELPQGLAGKSIRDINIRKRFNIEIIMIKKLSVEEGTIPNRPGIFPYPEYVLEIGDNLLILCRKEDLKRFREQR